MKPVVKVEGDVVVMVMSKGEAQVIRTLIGSAVVTNKKWIDPMYDALVKHFPHPLPITRGGMGVSIDYSFLESCTDLS